MSDNHPLKIYILCCSNCIDAVTLRHALKGQTGLKTISVPCSGKVELIYFLKAFESGADGVLMITCEKGACHYMEGNLRASKRVAAVDDMLKETGLGSRRIKMIQCPGNDAMTHLLEELELLRATIEKADV